MTPDPSQTPEDRPPHGPRPAPDVTTQRLADRWDATTWRHALTGAVLGLLALPALASALVGLLVLVVQGAALWLLVTAAALVTAALAAGGAAVALRRGHRGVAHRLALLAGAWGLVTTVGAVVLALVSDAADRVGVAVLLVLGGTYTLVVALGLWGAWRVLPAPASDGHDDVDPSAGPEPGPATRTGATPTVSEVPTPAAAPDDDELAEWPEWGGAPRPGDAHGGAVTGADASDVADAARVDPPRADVPRADVVGPYVGPPYVRPADDDASDQTASGAPASDEPANDEPARDARTSGTRPPAPRATPRSSGTPRTSGTARTSGGAVRTSGGAARTSGTASRTSGSSRASGSTSRTSSTAGPTPPRRSATSGAARAGRATSAGPATERIAHADGDEGPPTQRLPPLDV